MVNKNSVGYYGFAHVSFFKGKDKVKTIKIKNNGTELLFELLAKSICGINVTNLMPKYFDMGVYTVEQSIGTFDTALSNRIPLTSAVIEDVPIQEHSSTAAVAAKFTAFVPNRTFNADSYGETINCLRLYNVYGGGPDEGLLAQIDLIDGGEDSEVINVSQASQYSLMIEWIMTFGNVISVGG